MARDVGACLVCGKPIVYYESARKMECVMCHGEFESHASCEDGHYVCDECHAKRGIQAIMEGCGKSKEKDPISIMQKLMEDPYIYMHGPEHHVMVGSALLTAYRNGGGEIELEKALAEMMGRGKKVPGGTCGFWGACGAGISAGMFVSIISKSTPLAVEPFGLSHLMTSKALGQIGMVGGPRCCKRDSYLSILATVDFVKDNFGIEMEKMEVVCGHFSQNNQCIGKRCPFSKVNH